MDIADLERKLGIDGISAEQQMEIISALQQSAAEKIAKAKSESIGKGAELVIQGLKKIKSDMEQKFAQLNGEIQSKVASIQDGQDGKDGKDGRDGRQGPAGSTGATGRDGVPGRDGVDGANGIGVASARIDFDGSLIITLDDGREINAGEVVTLDIAERIKVITNGGGTSQYVLDTLASLQAQISAISGGLSYQGTWNASTNTPTLTSSSGTSNYYYVVSTPGSTNLDGITDWKAGDWLIYNGTAWQKIDQSWAIAGANDNITSMTGVTGGISSPDFIQFDTAATVTNATGKLYYNAEDQFQTLSFQMNGNQIQHIGEELYYRVKLSSAATKGQVLMFTGTLGASGGLQAAPATGLQPEQASYILGVAAETGSTNDWIFVTTFGEVKSINTTGGAESWAQGDVLYYNPSVTGGLTKTKPAVPNAICLVAAVVHVGSSNGVLFVRPTYGSVLGGTDGNVNFTSLASGNTLIYDAVAGVWENAFLTDGTGINIAEGAGTITVGLASGYGDTLNPYASKTANYVLASPNGSAGVPTFRAIVAADVPTLNQNTTGTAASTPKLLTTNFTIEESGGKLLFKYGATTIASMSSTGVITSVTNIVANGTP